MRRGLGQILLAVLAGLAFPLPAQQRGIATEEPALQVRLVDGSVRAYTRSDLDRLPLETAMASLRDRPASTVSGVSVTTLLRLAGLDLGANLGSAAVVGRVLVARAADGYVAAFGLAEVDPHFGHAPLLVVWKNVDGSALPARSGPFELINTGESRGGRWVRQLLALEVRDAP